MNTEKVSTWVQITANIGLFAGLILLAIEINQNTASLQGSSYQAWAAAKVELNLAFADQFQAEAYASGIYDSSNLTEESYLAFAMWNYGALQMAQTVDFLYRMGSLDHELWDTEINRAAGILSLPGVRQLWDAGAKSQFAPSFVELIEPTESNTTRWEWDKNRGFHPFDDSD